MFAGLDHEKRFDLDIDKETVRLKLAKLRVDKVARVDDMSPRFLYEIHKTSLSNLCLYY